MAQASGRNFLFLQGPHGPFYRRLAETIVARGARVRRVGFNRSDIAEWGRVGPADLWDGAGDYAGWIDRLMRRHGTTDLVVYGDTRAVHAEALEVAGKLGLRTHRLEEGYIRPFWITYERRGTNGASPARTIPLAAMARALADRSADEPDLAAPSGWGAVRPHLAWSALYHARLLALGRGATIYQGHRRQPVHHEIGHYCRRAADAPFRAARQTRIARRLARIDPPYHVVLLQLSFDCSMAAFGPFESNADLVRMVVDGFAAGAPPHHHLVFRPHPFEDGREGLERVIRDVAAAQGLGGRVHLLGGGSLGSLLDGAESAVTVNSTAGQQALSRSLPLLALGEAVYSRKGLVQNGDVAAFFEEPALPDPSHYKLFRRFLLATSQLRGSFYGAAGIDDALKRLPDAMLSNACPYKRLQQPGHVTERGQGSPCAPQPVLELCS